MRISFVFIAMIALFGSCSESDWKSLVVDDEMIEYKLQSGQYAVVIILNERLTLEQAKQAARHRAAELAVSGGYRYFLIQSETETRVVKQLVNLEKDLGEMIIEGDFGKGQLSATTMTETAFPALKVVFQCFDKKPKGKSINACNLTDCSKVEKCSETPSETP